MRGRTDFKQRTMTRVIKAALAAGIEDPVVELETKTGLLRVFCSGQKPPKQNDEKQDSDNTWGENATSTTAER